MRRHCRREGHIYDEIGVKWSATTVVWRCHRCFHHVFKTGPHAQTPPGSAGPSLPGDRPPSLMTRVMCWWFGCDTASMTEPDGTTTHLPCSRCRRH